MWGLKDQTLQRGVFDSVRENAYNAGSALPVGTEVSDLMREQLYLCLLSNLPSFSSTKMRSDVRAATAIELQSPDDSRLPTSPEDRVEDGVGGMGHEMPSLPPVDGGKDAWLFLAACFMIEALVWGAWRGLG